MGSVYWRCAPADEFQKRVAIKLIKRGMDTDFIIRRVRNSARFWPPSTPEYRASFGRRHDRRRLPYFVRSSLVEVQPIHHYCATQKPLNPERLKLFLKACSAVAFAHHNLIIHRDLKPSNILVSPTARPSFSIRHRQDSQS